MARSPEHCGVSRCRVLTGLVIGGVLSGLSASQSLGKPAAESGDEDPAGSSWQRYLTVDDLKQSGTLADGEVLETSGFHAPVDGGGAFYQVRKANEDVRANEADVIALRNGLVAVLLERQAVNYRMFGAVGDGKHDDGVQIKLAHEYANKHQIPVVNASGEFWIKQTNNIRIVTNVHWGKTIFHIDERFNSKRYARFVVDNDAPPQPIALDATTKKALLNKIQPGVQIISELAPFAGCLVFVVDSNDRIGVRAGAGYSKRGWAREEFFYVEEEGRIIGDIAWSFKDLTSVTAVPCNDNYLVIEGGGFYFSGDTPENSSPGYHRHGILIKRSRMIIREQWMGLEPGKKDVSLEPRSGFYSLSRVYDVTLENIRAMPWEKNRREKDKAVKHGTYGIGGARMLNCTFRNLTADAGWVAWGVFGTNLNKNFRVENCRLNRVDVHFHCWNLHIRDCTIGFKGISVTGGGRLVIENTVRDGNYFVSFRQDYGAKWDGPIRISNCTLRPTGGRRATVLSFHPSNFDYQYPIGFGRDIMIENLTVDHRAMRTSKATCWLMDVGRFSNTENTGRLFFPERIVFRNIRVEGGAGGVRLVRLPNPYGFQLAKEGVYDVCHMRPNCRIVCDTVQLEQVSPRDSKDTDNMHLLIGGEAEADYADQQALYPSVRFTDCENVCVRLDRCIASLFFDRCTVNTVSAFDLRGELTFRDCHLQPSVRRATGPFCAVTCSLGTRFTNCTIHAPIVGGKPSPEQIDRIGFLRINQALDHSHLNTALGHDVLEYLKGQGVELSAEFLGMLTAHQGSGRSKSTSD